MNVVGQNLKENVRVKWIFSKIFIYKNFLFHSKYMKKIDNKMNTNELKNNKSIQNYINDHQLSMFFVFAFAITWGMAGTFLLLMPLLIQVWGPVNMDNPYYFTI